MDITNKRQEVLNCCENIIEKNSEIQNSKNHILIKKMSEQIFKRSKEIKNICEVEKYNLFFNGKVAIGKSTIICTMFDLIDYILLTEGSRLSNSLLLKTGSGRTTICETQIITNSDRSEILIEEVTRDDFYVYLKEFCESLYGKESNISEEGLNLMKNMAKIPLTLDNKEIIEKFSNLDEAFESFKNSISYEKRLNKNFVFDGDNFKYWLRKFFTEINDGKIELAPMPKKITIKICGNDIQFKIPEFINSIVDTRGLDGGERPDIQSYIVKKDAISLMCDEINGFGGNESITSILQQTLIQEDKDIYRRVLLIGMEKDGELENITNFEDDRAAGIKEKKRQALKKINDSRINLTDKNFFFFDTAPGISVEKGKITKIDFTTLKNTQKEFIETLETLICNMYSNYCDELYDSLRLLEQLNRGQITENTLNKINHCKKIISEIYEEVNSININILKRFEDAIKEIYHSSLRGAVNHYGIGNTADVYGTFKKCGGEEFVEQCREYKSKMLASIDLIFEDCSELETICLKYINDEINNLYKCHYTNYRDLAYSETYDNLYNYNSWTTPQKYWGDGLGKYKARVWKDINNEIKSHDIDITLENNNNIVQFFRDILNFMDI